MFPLPSGQRTQPLRQGLHDSTALGQPLSGPVLLPLDFRATILVCFDSDTPPCPLPTQGPLHRMLLSPVKELSHIQLFLNFGKLPSTQPGCAPSNLLLHSSFTALSAAAGTCRHFTIRVHLHVHVCAPPHVTVICPLILNQYRVLVST